MSSRLRLGGTSTQPAAARDSYASRDFFTTERISPDDYELGGYAIFVLVVGGSCAIVLGLVMSYMVFV